MAFVTALVIALVTALAPTTTPGATADVEHARRADPCARPLPTLAAYGDAFGALAGSGSGYDTADGFVPVALPDGRTAWLMSDTLLGPPTAPAPPVGPPLFVHNSIVVQRGRCLTPVLGGTAEARTDLVPEVFGRWCWPSAGVARVHTLLVFCTLVETAAGPPGFGFAVVGSAMATFHLPDFTFTGYHLLPFAEPAGVAPAVTWGAGSVTVGRTVYVYGSDGNRTYVARAPFARLMRGPWQFWNGRGWTTRPTAATPMRVARGTPARGLSITRVGARGGYAAVGFPYAIPDPRLAGWTATRPEGPWHSHGIVGGAQTDGGQFAYDARLTDLDGPGWTIVYDVNDPVGLAQDPTRYGGRFVPARAQGTSKWWTAG